jgi:ribosomal protein L13E
VLHVTGRDVEETSLALKFAADIGARPAARLAVAVDSRTRAENHLAVSTVQKMIRQLQDDGLIVPSPMGTFVA